MYIYVKEGLTDLKRTTEKGEELTVGHKPT